MELPEGTLVTNIFVPLMVVCSKMDLVEHGEKELKSLLEQNLDFLQHSLRKFCLTYGASLAFASSNSNSNIKLIYEYILHRLYETEFAHTSNTNDKDALFSSVSSLSGLLSLPGSAFGADTGPLNALRRLLELLELPTVRYVKAAVKVLAPTAEEELLRLAAASLDE